jgi:hypothetical protein
MTEGLRAYCPVCEELLDSDDRCWGVCALAGIAQPPIHLAPVETDEYEIRDGTGRVISRHSVVRAMVQHAES